MDALELEAHKLALAEAKETGRRWLSNEYQARKNPKPAETPPAPPAEDNTLAELAALFNPEG